MKTIELNIGVNNNPLNIQATVELVKDIFDLVITEVRIVQGEYNNQQEDTIAILAKTDIEPQLVRAKVALLCKVLKQECIAYTLSGAEELVYAFGFEGKKDIFRPEFFKSLQNFGEGVQTGGIRTGVKNLNGVIKKGTRGDELIKR